LANAEKGAAFLDQAARRNMAVIQGGQIDWERWLRPEDRSRVIPAEALAEECRSELLLGKGSAPGLRLPWEKTHSNILVRPGTLILWAGWSRHGKTRMLKQTMLHAIKSGEKAIIASMEEAVRGVWKDMARMACCTPEPSPRELDRFVQFVRGNLWLYDQQGVVSPQKMQALIRYAASEMKVTHAVVDSLMMMGIAKDDYAKQAEFLNELHCIAMNTGVTIHLVVHMRKRDGKGGEENPGSLHDIAGGQELGAIADSVFIVWRNVHGANKELPPAILKVDKQRGDVDWMGTIGLRFNDKARQFVEDVHPMTFWDQEGVNF
jgi:twinkle protein